VEITGGINNIRAASVLERVVLSLTIGALLLLWAFPVAHVSYWYRGVVLLDEGTQPFTSWDKVGAVIANPNLDPAVTRRYFGLIERKTVVSWITQAAGTGLILALGSLAYWTVKRRAEIEKALPG
jgi:hypothetical protein